MSSPTDLKNIAIQRLYDAAEGVATLPRLFGKPSLWLARIVTGYKAPRCSTPREEWTVRAAGIATLAALQLTVWNTQVPVPSPLLEGMYVLGNLAIIGIGSSIGKYDIQEATPIIVLSSAASAIAYWQDNSQISVKTPLLAAAALTAFSVTSINRASHQNYQPDPLSHAVTHSKWLIYATSLIALSALTNGIIAWDRSHALNSLGDNLTLLGTAALGGMAGGLLGRNDTAPYTLYKTIVGIPREIGKAWNAAIYHPTLQSYANRISH